MNKIHMWRSPYIYVFMSLTCLILIFLNLYELSSLKIDHNLTANTDSQPSSNLKNQDKVFVIYGRDIHSGYLQHVFDILQLYGFTYASLTESTDWDLLWAHDYPFKHLSLKNLQPFQKVNHFPGSGFITNKIDLSTSNMPFTPKAFKLPTQKNNFYKYVSDHPKSKYVVKSNDHRGIKILDVENINFNKKGIFIQEYIDDPLLVDGFKFDIGVYTIISSIDPLRVYIYDGDALFRYCSEKYLPFDPAKLNKYVIGDDYLPTWKVESLKPYYSELGFSMKKSFNAYLSERGQDYNIIWKNIEEAIRLVCVKKEPLILKTLSSYKSRHNFFELMRFDFVVDTNLNVFLMEVNMSPNLSSLHFRPNKLLYEQVLFNAFSLIGLGTPQRIGLNNSALVADKNIVTSSMNCKNCEDCSQFKCQLCLPCILPEMKIVLKLSYLEHMNKRDYKRIFPCPWVHNTDSYNLEFTTKNKLLMMWYQEKCKEDKNWCC